MRLFQNSGLYPTYRRRLDQLAAEANSFEQRIGVFLDDRFGALHFLKPVLDFAPEAFFTNGDDETLQQMWAKENGLGPACSMEDILLAQIEQHRTDVFYNNDPIRYPSDFVRRLPGCVKKAICWRAAPSGNADLSAYNLVVSNFPSILDDWRQKGCQVAYFLPAIDPVMERYGVEERPIDVLFVGGYSRHHSRRAKILERVAALANDYNVVFCLDNSRLTRLADTPLGLFPPLRAHRRAHSVSRIAQEPVFGRQLYKMLSQSKIVLNGAIDMAGEDRGNMRCFEAMGCGALLLSDAGRYPEGMKPGDTMEVYSSADQVAGLIELRLAEPDATSRMAQRGRLEVAQAHSKEHQWRQFSELAG